MASCYSTSHNRMLTQAGFDLRSGQDSKRKISLTKLQECPHLSHPTPQCFRTCRGNACVQVVKSLTRAPVLARALRCLSEDCWNIGENMSVKSIFWVPRKPSCLHTSLHSLLVRNGAFRCISPTELCAICLQHQFSP